MTTRHSGIGHNDSFPGYNAQLIQQEWYNGYLIDEDVFGLVKKLKGKYALIAFSGNIKSRVRFLDQKYDFQRWFDREVYSFDYRVSKPEREFFEALIKAAGCSPRDIICVDDNPKNEANARALGITVVLYHRGAIKKLIDDLGRLGVSPYALGR